MSAYTPGPWFVGAQNDALYIIDAPPRPSNDDMRHESDVTVIAKVYGSKLESEIVDANARVLAAATEMLEACRAFMTFRDSVFCGLPLCINGKPIDHTTLNHAAYLAQHAIAKAEGR